MGSKKTSRQSKTGSQLANNMKRHETNDMCETRKDSPKKGGLRDLFWVIKIEIERDLNKYLLYAPKDAGSP